MAARQLGLIGAAAMFHAIREPGVHLLTAEMKVRLARVAHRPAADPVAQVEQAGLVGHFRAGLGRNQTARRGGRDRGLLIAGAESMPAAPADSDYFESLRTRVRKARG